VIFIALLYSAWKVDAAAVDDAVSFAMWRAVACFGTLYCLDGVLGPATYTA
jgi:hypothetical protein